MKPFFRLAVLPVLSAAIIFAAHPLMAQDSDSENNADANIARLQVRITQLEEQIRKLQGMVEQASFENRQLKTQMDKANADIEYRLSALEKKQTADNPQPPSSPAPAESGKLAPVEPSGGKEEPSVNLPKFANSRDHYNYAFKLLNQAKYPEAGSAFSAFTKAYPRDPLIGNAWYWLGETYYVRRDYVKAADDFRQGYEAMPTGPKASDNLLKLAMSLNAMKKDKEACIVLKQVATKFGSSSKTMRQRAEQEMNTIGCN